MRLFSATCVLLIVAIVSGISLAQTSAEDLAAQYKRNTGLMTPSCSVPDNAYLYVISSGYPISVAFYPILSCKGTGNQTITVDVSGVSDRLSIQPASGSVKDRVCRLILEYDNPLSGEREVAATYLDTCGRFVEQTIEDYPPHKWGGPISFVFWGLIWIMAFFIGFGVQATKLNNRRKEIRDRLANAPLAEGEITPSLSMKSSARAKKHTATPTVVLDSRVDHMPTPRTVVYAPAPSVGYKRLNNGPKRVRGNFSADNSSPVDV